MLSSLKSAIALGLVFVGAACSPSPNTELTNKTLNLYTARHYASDDAMLARFTQATGIAVQTRKGDSTSLLEIMKAEGNTSPADLIIASDAGTLWRFQDAGLTAPLKDATLEGVIPAPLRDADGHWFGLSKRYRIIAYDKAKYSADQFPTYSSLTEPEFNGAVCVRPSSNIYNLSLMGEMIARLGEDAATQWAKGVVANFARSPRGGDRTQIRGIASGECGVAIVNHYYWLRMLASGEGDDFLAANKVGLAFPDISADIAGSHTNVTAIAMAKNAPHPDAALALLQYLVSEAGQADLVAETYEKPVLASLPLPPVYDNLPAFNESGTPLGAYGKNQTRAQKLLLEADWQ